MVLGVFFLKKKKVVSSKLIQFKIQKISLWFCFVFFFNYVGLLVSRLGFPGVSSFICSEETFTEVLHLNPVVYCKTLCC